MSSLTQLRRLVIKASEEVKDIDVLPSTIRGTAQGVRKLHINNEEEQQTFEEIQHHVKNTAYNHQNDLSFSSISFYLLSLCVTVYVIYNVFFSNRKKNFEASKQSYVYNKSSQPEQPHLVQIFHDNGNLKSEVTFIKDEMNGELKLYYKNGNIAATMNYDKGIKNGEEVTYYVNGQIKSQGYYKNGKKDGVIKEYLQDGKLASETTYLNGVFSCKNVYVEETAINKNKI